MSKKSSLQIKVISSVMLITLTGKLLGLIRDRMLSVHYGTAMEASAFLTASRIPRVFFDMLFASAIAASFIPVFSEVLEKKGERAAQKFAGSFITVIGLLTLLMTAAGILFSGQLVELFAAGYDAETASLSTRLTCIMFPTVFFTGIAYSFVGILQSYDEFNIPAFISVLSNLIIILYYPLLNGRFGIYGLAAAFLVGWSMQAMVQIPSLRRKGFRYRPSLNMRSEEMKKVFALMLPVMVSTWVQPITLTINSRFASYLYNGGGVPAIEYSTNLYLMIIGVFILSVTNVIFPKLSRLQVSDQQNEFQNTVRSTMHASLFFVIPLMFGVMSLSSEVIDLIYGGGQFGAEDIQITGKALLFTSLGMIGYAVQNILSRVYFAKQNGTVPLVAGIFAIVIDAVLCLLLVGRWKVSGLAVAAAVSGTVNAIVLMIPLEWKKQGFLSRKFVADMLKVTTASAVMAAAVRLSADALTGLLFGMAGKLLVIVVPTVLGLVIFFVLARLMRVDEAVSAGRLLRRTPSSDDDTGE